MYAQKEKPKDNKSQSVTNTVSQKRSDCKSTFQFEDNRHEAIAQRKLQEIANDYSATQQPLIQKKENKTGLPNNLKSGIENLSGYSMDDVRVHYNSDKPAQLQAHAYAQGSNIHLGSGQEKHLGHEAWHVVQQKQGRVRPTMQMKGGVNVNDDEGLEKEADVMGRMADNQIENHNIRYVLNSPNSHNQGSAVVQRILNVVEKEKLENARIRFKEEKENYQAEKEKIKNIDDDGKFEQKLITTGKVGLLNQFREDKDAAFKEYDKFFQDAEEHNRNAHNSKKDYQAFIAQVNQYTQSGGKNKLDNLIKTAEKLYSLPKFKLSVPSVVHLADYNLLFYKVRDAVHWLSYYATSVKDLEPIKEALKAIQDVITEFRKTDEVMTDGLKKLTTLQDGLRQLFFAKQDLIQDGFKEFFTIEFVDKKSSLMDSLFEDESTEVGDLNVASRSNKREGKYMRSQDDHDGNKSNHGQNQNPLGVRMKPFLQKDAKDYNIGGSAMIADRMMEQKKLRPKKRNNSPDAFNALRDDIIKHKNEQVAYIVNKLKGIKGNLFVPEKQLEAKYPCVLILFSEALLKQVNESQTNIPEFMTHFMIGHANVALAKAGLRPLIERRQSFGFMTPTMTDVHSGVRLSIGITPSEAWSDAVIEGLKAADRNIGNIKGYENLGEKQEAADDHVTMNKFNRGSVLGAGHKLISKLLEVKQDLKSSDINAVFGKNEGDDLVKEIEKFTPKDAFEKQEISEEALTLLNRLKSFYEHYIATAGKKDVKKVRKKINWWTVDPAEELQKLMDESLKATYSGGKGVIGLDESSDEEDEEINRTPSGMSALALPVVAYREVQRGKDSEIDQGKDSLVYDTAPFSYFEIDGSWKGTFNVDMIERLGTRFPLYKNNLKVQVELAFETHTKKHVGSLKSGWNDRLKELEKQKEEATREIYNRKKEQLKALDEEYRLKYKEAEDNEKKHVITEEIAKTKEVEKSASDASEVVRKDYQKDKDAIEAEILKGNKELVDKIRALNYKLIGKLHELFNLLDEYMKKNEDLLTAEKLEKESLIKQFKKSAEGDLLENRIYSVIIDAFNKDGLQQMQKAKKTEKTERVEVAYVDVNPCMTSEAKFDSGANLYLNTLKQYQGLRMIVLDTTSSTVKQVNDLVEMFQNQDDPAVPFLCLAKSSTKHDQMGLDISTLGRTQYIIHKSYIGDKIMEGEFVNLQAASRRLAQNTEPLMVKKMRRDMKKAAGAGK